ncbi:MAG: hypothetical protein ABIS18_11280 [Actinomycetota bacterium]
MHGNFDYFLVLFATAAGALVAISAVIAGIVAVSSGGKSAGRTGAKQFLWLWRTMSVALVELAVLVSVGWTLLGDRIRGIVVPPLVWLDVIGESTTGMMDASGRNLISFEKDAGLIYVFDPIKGSTKRTIAIPLPAMDSTERSQIAIAEWSADTVLRVQVVVHPTDPHSSFSNRYPDTYSSLVYRCFAKYSVSVSDGTMTQEKDCQLPLGTLSGPRPPAGFPSEGPFLHSRVSKLQAGPWIRSEFPDDWSIKLAVLDENRRELAFFEDTYLIGWDAEGGLVVHGSRRGIDGYFRISPSYLESLR